MFCPHPFAKVLEDCVGLECFWPFTDVSQSSTLVSTLEVSCTHVDSPLVRLSQGSGQSSRGEAKFDTAQNNNTFLTISSIGRKFWHGKDCKLVDDIGVVIVKGRINACDPKEVVLDEDLGETNVGVTILSYPHDITEVMAIWRWLLSQTILNGHSLLLGVYNEQNASNDDDEGMTNV